jgi:hypothetical protein
MIPRLIEAHYNHDYIIHLKFQDGAEGEADLRNELYGEVFEPLKAQSYFRQFRVHPDLHTLTWPNWRRFRA